MALPSIVLVRAFSGGVFGTMVGFLVRHGEDIFGHSPSETVGAILVGAMALITAAAPWAHWNRFMVPITVPAGTAAPAPTAVALVLAITGLPTHGDTLTIELVSLARLPRITPALPLAHSAPRHPPRGTPISFLI